MSKRTLLSIVALLASAGVWLLVHPSIAQMILVVPAAWMTVFFCAEFFAPSEDP